MASVQAQPRAWCGWPVDDDPRQRFLEQHASCLRAPAATTANGRARPPVSRLRLMRPLPRSLGFGAIFPFPTGPSSSSPRTPATPSESFRGHRTPAAAAIRSSRTRRRWTPRETVDGLRSANTTPRHPVSRAASQCAATAGLHPSPRSHEYKAGTSGADAICVPESMEPIASPSHCSGAIYRRTANLSRCLPSRKLRPLDNPTGAYFSLSE